MTKKVRRQSSSFEYDNNIASYIGGSFWQINKKMVRVFGIVPTLWIVNVFERWRYHVEKGDIKKDGYFYFTQTEIEKQTGINARKQTEITRNLQKLNILYVKRKGLPRKNYYRIELFKLLKVTKESNLQCNGITSLVQRNYITGSTELRNSNKQLSNKELRINKSSSKKKKRFSKENLLRPQKTFLKRRSKIERPTKQSTKQPLKNSHHLRRPSSIFLSYPREVKEIFRSWNDLGPPFVKHQEKITSTFKKAANAILKKLNKYTQSEILKTIKVYHQLISDKDSILNKNIPGHVVGLHEFFSFSKHTKARMQKQKVDLPIKSWFRECLDNDFNSLQEAYGKYVKDKHPNVTNKFIELWKEYKGNQSWSVKDENSLRQAATRFVQYHKVNRDRIDFNTLKREHLPVNCVEYVFEAMNEDVDGDWSKVTPSWLASDKMFTHRLPNYFKSRNMFLYEGPEFHPSDALTYDEYSNSTIDDEDEYDDEDAPDLAEEFI